MKHILIFLLITVFLISCQPVAMQNSIEKFLRWKYSDLRLLDPIDSDEPDHDLIALYTRRIDTTFQIRIDFLDLVWMNGHDIYVPLDIMPGGLSLVNMNGQQVSVDVNWDYLISFPANGKIIVVDNNYSPVSNLELLIVRNNFEDYITFSLNSAAFPLDIALTKLQVILVSKYGYSIFDKTLPVSIDSPPPEKVKIAFLFWNTLTSSTPAGTLRSWDGAHSGPGRNRHGLRNLLDAAEETNTPIVLMNLATPENLSALDYINALPKIKALEDRDIIGLTNFYDLSLDDIELQNGHDFSINGSMVFRANEIETNLNYPKIINSFDLFALRNIIYYDYYNGSDYAHLDKYLENCPYAIHSKSSSSIYEDISLGCKSLLLTSAISKSGETVILGGDFSASSLGSASISKAFFSYVKQQPWIQVLSILEIHTEFDRSPNQADYLEVNESTIFTNPINNKNISVEYLAIYHDILKAPRNQLSELAFQVFISMITPTSSEMANLNSNYISQLRHIIEAAKWADHPEVIRTCEKDIDNDGYKECIFSDEHYFLTVEPIGGYIPFIFTKIDGEIHQIVGPTWELMLGISDPSSWDLSEGVYSDQGQILGALQIKSARSSVLNSNFMENNLVLSNVDMTMRSSIRLSAKTITIRLQNSTGKNNLVQFPIILDPWTRFSKDWGNKYRYSKTANGFIWGINSDISIEMISNDSLTNSYFNYSRNFMFLPEDPNFDYSLGHNLPYPLLLSELNASQDSIVVLKIYP